MKITIHRGTDQIGGCVTEYEHGGWRLFVDFGEQLPGAPEPHPLTVEGLTRGDLSKSALLITHYHGDHIGKIGELPSELPVYMGEIGLKIEAVLSGYLGSVDEGSARIAERLGDVSEFSPGVQFEFGPFTVTPITVDHSAFDASAFRIEAGGAKVFHTGDFRTHGFRGGKLPKVVERFVGPVDYVVCEGTNATRPDSAVRSEYELQQEFVRSFRSEKYNIVYVSSTNIDRLFALYHAALRAGRPFFVDRYQKRIMDIVVQHDRRWRKSDLFAYGKYEPKELQQAGREFRSIPEFGKFLAERGYVLIARANPRFANLIAKLPGEPKRRYLSMWNGYVDPGRKAAYNPALDEALGEDYRYMHTSGHCDMAGLDRLIGVLSPKAVIPMHTDSPAAFAAAFCDRWPVMLLADGEPFVLTK